MFNTKSKGIKRILIISIFLIIVSLIVVPIVLYILPVFLGLFKSGGKVAAIKYLHSFGVKGIIIIEILQIMQVLSLVLPAPTIWVISGATYGVFYGMLISIVGVVIGNSIAFFIGRKYGNKLMDILFDEKSITKFKFLENTKFPGIIQFLMYVIPGVPNNIIPYIYARTNISALRFISTIAIASVLSILSCTYVGYSFLSGSLTFSVIIILVLVSLSVILLKYNKNLLRWLEEFSINHRTP